MSVYQKNLIAIVLGLVEDKPLEGMVDDRDIDIGLVYFDVSFGREDDFLGEGR